MVSWSILLGVLVGVMSGCASEPDPLDRVGVNVVDKALFDGSWYMSRTVIDVDYAGSQVGTFPGDIASDTAQTFTALPRIRWVIDEDFLLAYRDYRLVADTDPDPRGTRPEPAEDGDKDDVYGEPVAAYKIEKHFDVRRQYNTSTGEERNVIVENSTDQPWYARKYMRVDWSKNHLPAFFGQTADLQEVFGVWNRQPVDLFVQDASQLPQSWSPSFDFFGCDADAQSADDAGCPAYEWDLRGDYESGEFYHMSFVSQEVLAPGGVDGAGFNWCVARSNQAVPACSNVMSYVRTSFLKVSDRRQYEPVNWVDTRYDKFGYFRLSQNVLDRSKGEPDDPAFGYTDFRNYNINRHNIWRSWHDDEDRPVPYRDRDVREIVWYTTPELPAHLVQPAFDVVGQWNESLMATVRTLRGESLPRYPDVACQTDDPDGYCFCQDGMPDTCPGRYDALTPPDAYEGDVRDAYDCWVEVPDGAEPDLDKHGLSDKDFYGWFGARFVGDECVTVLRLNACNRATIDENGGTVDGLPCEERGDLRLKFLSYVDQPGTGFLGIATLRSDPITGEIMAGDANIGGPALDSFRTSALETYDIMNGTLDVRDVVTGENVRTYLENLGRVDLPARPRSDFTVASRSGGTDSVMASEARSEIDGVMKRALQRIERLQGPDGRSQIQSDRRKLLVGSDIERRLMSGPEGLVMSGIDGYPAGDTPELTEELLDRASPFRNDAVSQLEQMREQENRVSAANVMMPNEYVDDSVQWFVNKHQGWSRARLEFGINRLLYRQTQLHEMGHCLGMRHNFGSSADRDHYRDEYHTISARFELPDPDAYSDLDGEAGMSPEEQAEFERNYTEVRKQRELAGIDGAMNTSVMEYSANWYQRLQPLGRYDHAAVMFAYGDLVEAYEGEARPTTKRGAYKYYLGGEVCERTSDCPYSEGGERAGELLESNLERGLTQRCVDNTRTRGARICTSFDEDVARAAENSNDIAPLSYLFCAEERSNRNLAWCNRFDEGDSYREIVRNIAESYDRVYPFAAFRRYNRTFSINGYLSSLIDRRLSVLQNISNNLVYRYALQPEFRSTTGPFGFYDQFAATTDVLNFYARILAQPDVGAYRYQSQTNSYRWFDIDPEAEDADLKVPLGMGRYYYSDYQGGLSGIERIERIGSFYDKIIAMQLLTFRGLSGEYTADITFFTNFYDLFPNEMQQIFSGLIRGSPGAFMPRILCPEGGSTCSEPHVSYLDFYRGDCSNDATCRPNPATKYQDVPVLDGGGSISLQIYAALYGLSEFPIYFDSTFQNQLFICIEGQGDCFVPDEGAVEGTDYVRYQSDFYRRTFLAFQVEPKENVGEQISIGFEMVKEASDLATVGRALDLVANGENPNSLENLTDEVRDELAQIGYEVPSSPPLIRGETTRVRQRLNRLESFFNQMIEFQRRFGITALVLN